MEDRRESLDRGCLYWRCVHGRASRKCWVTGWWCGLIGFYKDEGSDSRLVSNHHNVVANKDEEID